MYYNKLLLNNYNIDKLLLVFNTRLISLHAAFFLVIFLLLMLYASHITGHFLLLE